MEAIILGGGKGTRLASAVSDVPKILAPVNGAPFLDLLVRYLSEGGAVTRIIVAAGHQGEMVAEHCARRVPPPDTDVVIEDRALGTGGALLNALEATAGERVLVINGDSLIAEPVADIIAWDVVSGFDAGLVAAQVTDAGRYGLLKLDGGRLTGFSEKTGTGAGWINAGVYIFARSALAGIAVRPCSLERDILPALIDAGVAAYRSTAPFIDIGTPEDYARAGDFLRRHAMT